MNDTSTIEERAHSLRRLRLLRDIGAILVVLAALALVVFTTISKRDETNKLRLELEATAAQVEEARTEEAEIVECITRFTYQIQGASANTLAAIGDLVVIISQTVPGPERDAAITDQIDVLAASTLIYNETIKARVEYDTTVPKLPCPLAPGLNG